MPKLISRLISDDIREDLTHENWESKESPHMEKVFQSNYDKIYEIYKVTLQHLQSPTDVSASTYTTRGAIDYLHKLNQWVESGEGPRELTILDKGTRDTIPSTVEFPIFERLVPLMKNLLQGDATLILSAFSSIHHQLNSAISLQKENIDELVSGVEGLQILFGLVKQNYSNMSMKYEIYDRIESRLSQMKVALGRKDLRKSRKYSKYMQRVFTTLVKSRKIIKSAEAEKVVIEDTGKRLGKMQVYRWKKS